METDFSGVVRRSDLYLRGAFLQLKTTIYQIDQNKFVIYCDGVNGDFKEFLEHFDYSIRMVTTPAHLANIIPLNFVRIMSGIPDSEVAKGARLATAWRV